jgi:hypothetical protein
VISEDWHIYLRCFFAKRGQISLKRIFLPFSGNAVNAETLWQAITSYYQQKMRHAWGAQDVGYILQQWRGSPDIPLLRKRFCLGRVMGFHLMWSTTWFLIIQGWLVSIRLQFSPGEPMGADFIIPGPFRYFGLVWLTVTAIILIIERVRARPGGQNWRLTALAPEFIAWITSPFISLGLFALPALHAQTKMLLGGEIAFVPTPKIVVDRPSPDERVEHGGFCSE